MVDRGVCFFLIEGVCFLLFKGVCIYCCVKGWCLLLIQGSVFILMCSWLIRRSVFLVD